MSVKRDKTWFMEQVKAEESRLRGFIRALGVRPSEVDDFAQDAFIVAYEKLDSFGETGGDMFGPWVRGIARKLVANAIRKSVRRQQIMSDHLTDLMLESRPEAWHPLVEAAGADRVSALKACLEELPEYSRQVVQMRYFLELSPGAIGGRLERSANGIRQILFRVRKALLECVEKRMALVP